MEARPSEIIVEVLVAPVLLLAVGLPLIPSYEAVCHAVGQRTSTNPRFLHPWDASGGDSRPEDGPGHPRRGALRRVYK